jgi:hypothetical protein
MLTWAQILLAAFGLVSSLVAYARERQLIKEADERAFAKFFAKQMETVDEALKARQSARDANAAVPPADSLPDDGFRRD